MNRHEEFEQTKAKVDKIGVDRKKFTVPEKELLKNSWEASYSRDTSSFQVANVFDFNHLEVDSPGQTSLNCSSSLSSGTTDQSSNTYGLAPVKNKEASSCFEFSSDKRYGYTSTAAAASDKVSNKVMHADGDLTLSPTLTKPNVKRRMVPEKETPDDSKRNSLCPFSKRQKMYQDEMPQNIKRNSTETIQNSCWPTGPRVTKTHLESYKLDGNSYLKRRMSPQKECEVLQTNSSSVFHCPSPKRKKINRDENTLVCLVTNDVSFYEMAKFSGMFTINSKELKRLIDDTPSVEDPLRGLNQLAPFLEMKAQFNRLSQSEILLIESNPRLFVKKLKQY